MDTPKNTKITYLESCEPSNMQHHHRKKPFHVFSNILLLWSSLASIQILVKIASKDTHKSKREEEGNLVLSRLVK